jgi:hypothetical protein
MRNAGCFIGCSRMHGCTMRKVGEHLQHNETCSAPPPADLTRKLRSCLLLYLQTAQRPVTRYSRYSSQASAGTPTSRLTRCTGACQGWRACPVVSAQHIGGRAAPGVPIASHTSMPRFRHRSGPAAASPKRVTLRTLREKYKRGEPISMVTAYDYPSAVHVSCEWLERAVGCEGGLCEAGTHVYVSRLPAQPAGPLCTG